MGRRILIGLVLLCMCASPQAGKALSLPCHLPLAAEDGAWYFRVVSRDDSGAAQEEKFRVRDRIIPLLPEKGQELMDLLPQIHQAANQIAPCRVEIKLWAPDGMEKRPTLYITIREGAGPNWWGILYEKGAALTGEDGPEEDISIIWPAWEWIRKLFGW